MNNGGRPQFELAGSGDHGRTFVTRTIASVAAGCGPKFVSSCIPRTAMAAGAAGHVYAAWSGATAGGRTRAFFASSASGGRRWSVPDTVIPAGRRSDDQFRPQLSVTPGGRVDVEFNDLARAAHRQDVYLASSPTGGAPSRPLRLDSCRPTPASCSPTVIRCRCCRTGSASRPPTPRPMRLGATTAERVRPARCRGSSSPRCRLPLAFTPTAWYVRPDPPKPGRSSLSGRALRAARRRGRTADRSRRCGRP